MTSQRFDDQLVVITGAASGIAKATAHAVEQKTSILKTALPAETSYLYAPDGKTVLTMFYEEYRQYTKISDMSPNIQQAIVAAEDNRFYQHQGVDPKGVARAFVSNARSGGVSQGASTLTMQYVRMALRDSAKTPKEVQEATQQTSLRKVKEMRMALDARTGSTPPRRSSSPRSRPPSPRSRRPPSPAWSSPPPSTTRSPRTRRTPAAGATMCWTGW